MDASGFATLLTPAGWALLNELPPYDEGTALTWGSALREAGVAPELAAAALTQAKLRARATAKFGEFAARMLFTDDGLQQATRLPVAAVHARRFQRAGATKVADLCCGIGGDALALAGLGMAVLAVDRDEVTAAAATVNLSMFDNAEVRCADALEIDLIAEGVDGVFADPARRGKRGRVFDPAAYAPPLDAVLALRDVVPELGVKVAPGIPHTAIPGDAEAQWISVDGDVVEAGLWFGRTRQEGHPARSALLMKNGAATARSTADLPADLDPDALPVGAVGEYLYEPDGAIIRAGLLPVLVGETSGRLIDGTIAYVTSDGEARTPIAAGYRVLDHFDFQVKRLRAYLRERHVGRLTIKKRGTAVTPEQLRKQLTLSGDAAATIVLTRLAGRQSVLVVEPLTEGAPEAAES